MFLRDLKLKGLVLLNFVENIVIGVMYLIFFIEYFMIKKMDKCDLRS